MVYVFQGINGIASVVYDSDHLTEAEKKNGIMLERLPDMPEAIVGKYVVLKCNNTTGEVWYEYENAPKTEEQVVRDQLDKLEQENQLLKAQNNALSERADFIEDVVAEMAAQVYQ